MENPQPVCAASSTAGEEHFPHAKPESPKPLILVLLSDTTKKGLVPLPL